MPPDAVVMLEPPATRRQIEAELLRCFPGISRAKANKIARRSRTVSEAFGKIYDERRKAAASRPRGAAARRDRETPRVDDNRATDQLARLFDEVTR